MSVIQDALKRRLAEQQQGKIARGARPAGGSAPPPTPPVAEQVLRHDDASHAAAARFAEPRARAPAAYPPAQPGVGKWVFGTALLLLFAMLVIGVLLYLSRGIPLVAVPPPAVPPPAASPGPAAEIPSPPALSSSAESKALIPTPFPTVRPAGAPPATTQAGLIAVENPTVRIPRSQWPAITVDGVMAGSEPKKRSAILNGQMVFLNQKIDDVRLVEVRLDGVRLRFRGQEIDLEIGQVANDTDD